MGLHASLHNLENAFKQAAKNLFSSSDIISHVISWLFLVYDVKMQI